jgi:hypothetical protein
MRLFSEKVNPTFNSSGYNILTVKDYTEVFFDVYEFEINGSRFVAEKTGVFEDSPIVSIPVDYNNIVEQYDFVLHKGSQSIHFDPSTTSTPSHIKSTSDVEPLLVENVEEETDEVFLEDKKVAILEEIEKAKVAAAKYISQIEKQNKRELVNYQTEREVALKEDIDKQKKILLDEFYTLVEELRDRIAEESIDATLELKDLISDKLKKVSSNVDAQIASAERAIDTKIEERANELLNNVLLSEVKRSSKDIADNLNSQVKTIAENISKSLTSTKKQIEVDITEKLQEISTELNAKDKAIVELNDNVNKQSNRALSRIGTVKTQLEGTVKDVVDSLEARIDSASDKLTNYYNEKLQLVEASLSDASEHTKNHILGLIKESHQSLQNDIANIKVTVPNIVIEKSNSKQEIDVAALRTELEKSVSGRFVNEISSLKRLIELSSGGGSVAMQFAAGGTMNGNLTVVGAISASQYLGLSYLLNDYLPLSGGTVTGDVTVVGGLSADRIYTTQLDALSANITVIDIKQYELSGFNVTGDVTINGSVSSQNISAANLYSNGVQVATVVDPVRTTLTGNGVLSTFAISGAGGLVNPSALIVAIDGALQEPGADYGVSGGNIIFTSPLANGSKAVVISPVNTVQVGQVTPSDGSVTSAKIANSVTLTTPSLVGPVNLTSQDASAADRVMNRNLVDARIAFFRQIWHEVPASTFTSVVVAGATAYTAFGSQVVGGMQTANQINSQAMLNHLGMALNFFNTGGQGIDWQRPFTVSHTFGQIQIEGNVKAWMRLGYSSSTLPNPSPVTPNFVSTGWVIDESGTNLIFRAYAYSQSTLAYGTQITITNMISRMPITFITSSNGTTVTVTALDYSGTVLGVSQVATPTETAETSSLAAVGVISDGVTNASVCRLRLIGSVKWSATAITI